MLILLCLLGDIVQALQCTDNQLDYGVDVQREGDVQIAGIIWQSDSVFNTTSGRHDVTVSSRRYGLIRALAAALVIDDSPPLVGNYTLGYQFKDSCKDFWISRYHAMSLAQNNKIYGFLAPDYALFVAETIAIMTTNKIPSITWIDNEETLLDKEKYPYVSSLVDSAEGEGRAITRLLKQLGCTYFHMWYRSFSAETAENMRDSEENKCGRFVEMTTADFDDYPNTALGRNEYHTMDTGVKAADIHIVMLNSNVKTKQFFTHVKEHTDWRNKLYIIGFSSARDSYLGQLIELFRDGELGAFIALSNPILNHDRGPFEAMAKTMTPDPNYPVLNRLWEILHDCSLSSPNSTCNTSLSLSQGTNDLRLSSWTTFTALGTKLLITAINETLKEYIARDPGYKLAQCRWDFHRDVQTYINNMPPHNVRVFGSDVEDVHFINGTLDTVYGLKLYDPKVNQSTWQILGSVSQYKVISFNKTKLRPELALDCSVDCQPGYRKLVVSSTYACCWSCELCPQHHISSTDNSESCTECPYNQTADDARLNCTPVEIQYLSIDSMVCRFAVCMVIIVNIATIALLCIVITYRERPILKASDIYFCYAFITGNQLLAIASVFTIVKPSDFSCGMEYGLLSLSLSIITTPLTLRCFRIYLLFSATEVVIKPRFSFIYSVLGQYVIYCVCGVVTTAIAGYLVTSHQVWFLLSPQTGAHEAAQLMCSASTWLNAIPFLLPALLFLATLILSFKMRDYPHNFRETKSIFCSTVIILVSVATFCTGYSLAAPDMKAFTRCIVMLISTQALLGSLFLPKLRILFFTKLDIASERKAIKESVSMFTNKTVLNSTVSKLVSQRQGEVLTRNASQQGEVLTRSKNASRQDSAQSKEQDILLEGVSVLDDCPKTNETQT